MKRYTKIICTIGPASRQAEILLEMARAGMSVARLNFSHGNHQEHKQVIDTIRQVNNKHGFDIKILQDLAGYRIRVGNLAQPVELRKSQTVRMSNRPNIQAGTIPLRFDGDIASITKGMHVFIDDGNFCLQVIGFSNSVLELEVMHGGLLKSKKGVNIPELSLRANIFTAKDKEDIAFGILNGVDYIAQSFVRNKRDISRVIKMVTPHLPKCKIIAKIENRQGLKNIDNIIDVCDGILVARGDLGVSLPIYKIPIIQKNIIRHCNMKKKFVITATQMLDSMTEHARPTRAEVSDVANAILDGSDFVMLSGETAVGSFPVKSVTMMRQIVEHTEMHLLQNRY